MGAFDEALAFYTDALKSCQQCADGPVACAQILLSIASCQQSKGNLDEALEAAQEARSLLESTAAVELYESALTSVAQLAQSLYEDVKEDATTVLSGAIQANLSLAVECYERLFEGVRQRTEIDPARLLSVLKKIISLKMRLARPAHKILISAIKARKHQVSQSAVSDCIMRIVSAPTASSFMDRSLDRLEKPALAAAITSGSVSSGEAKEIFEEFSCLLQIVEN
jgi:tetratricopeptide (TPR) repeat protein